MTNRIPLKSRLKSRLDWLGAVAFSSVAIGIGLIVSTSPAAAQAAYGSYIGIGGSFGVTDGPTGEGGAAAA
ncbi:MAG: hypothetical protein EDM05_028055 [Leptolyngbya sp. IPPAS B-1204]